MARVLFSLAELEKIARTLELNWEDVLATAGLPKASKSRLKHGQAGRRTVEQVMKAIEDGARAKGPQTVKRLEFLGRAAAERPKQRAVIVEDDRHSRWYGQTDATDTEVAERRWIRLWDYREIQGKIISVASLSVHGPVDPLYAKAQSIGPVTASAILITGVAVVYDCTQEAVAAFAAFDITPKK
jgi:hypothetical protein